MATQSYSHPLSAGLSAACGIPILTYNEYCQSGGQSASPLDAQALFYKYMNISWNSDNKSGPTPLYPVPSMPTQYYLDRDVLDPVYDYDFTDRVDDGTMFYRGDWEYYRPYGWKRYALKVKGKYKNDDWLGQPGLTNRTYSLPGEWPVSYHGTAIQNAKSIISEGYQLSRQRRDRFKTGGIYQAPRIEIAEKYANTFQFNGKNYKMVFQNRVCSRGLTSIPSHDTGEGEFWSQSDSSLIRPYGICIREC